MCINKTNRLFHVPLGTALLQASAVSKICGGLPSRLPQADRPRDSPYSRWGPRAVGQEGGFLTPPFPSKAMSTGGLNRN